MSEGLLTVHESAQRLSLSPATLRKWLYQRRLRPIRLGRAVRLREADVDALARVGLRPEAGEP